MHISMSKSQNLIFSWLQYFSYIVYVRKVKRSAIKVEDPGVKILIKKDNKK